MELTELTLLYLQTQRRVGPVGPIRKVNECAIAATPEHESWLQGGEHVGGPSPQHSSVHPIARQAAEHGRAVGIFTNELAPALPASHWSANLQLRQDWHALHGQMLLRQSKPLELVRPEPEQRGQESSQFNLPFFKLLATDWGMGHLWTCTRICYCKHGPMDHGRLIAKQPGNELFRKRQGQSPDTVVQLRFCVTSNTKSSTARPS